MWAKRNALPGHSKEVLDLKWSPSGKYLISAGMDGRALVWNVDKQMYVAVLPGQTDKYLQGVAIDPLMEFAFTLGSNRELKIYKNSESNKRQDINFYCYKSLKKGSLAPE
jgi:chromatin assembly factor 1 subunit B